MSKGRGDLSVATLRSLLEETLDSGYRAATQDAPPGSGATRRGGALVVVGVLIAGVILGVAYRDNDRALPAQTATRQGLAAKVNDRRSTTETLQAAAATLREQITKARDQVLDQTTEGSGLLRRVTQLEVAAAEVTVTGPGIRITVADPKVPEGNDPVGGQATTPQYESLIIDRDLQRVCNALWQAGAEAISVDGQRLGPTSAIRQAGGAILVDFLPVSSPYVVEAIGSTDMLTAGFAGSAIGRKLSTYRNVYGAGLLVESADALTLKAALASEVAYAQPVGG